MSRAPRSSARIGDALLPLIRRRPQLITKVIAAHAARCERARVMQPDEQAAAIASFLDAAASGVGGMIDDYLTCSRDWGFAPSDVSAEVHLWHGVRDPLVPVEHALQLAITLPRCRVFFDPDEGHHFFRSRLGTILAVLVGRDEHPATSLEQARTMTNGNRRIRR